MKKIILFSIITLLIFSGTNVNAETHSPSPEELRYKIDNLLAQIASLQAILAERKGQSTIKGTPSITITEPAPFMTVKDGNSYRISWEAKNIPPSSMLILDRKAILLYGGSGLGGGSYKKSIAPGNTRDYRILDTGIGYSDPGTYEARVMVVACADILCSQPVTKLDPQTAKTIYLTKIYAKSDWVRYSITENEQINSINDTVTISEITPREGKFRLGEEMKISFYLSGEITEGQQACFLFHSSTGKTFSPNSNTYNACAPAKKGLNERYWTPYRTTGFKLDPGLYKIDIMVENPPNNSGKDYGYAGKKSSNWIELLPEV